MNRENERTMAVIGAGVMGHSIALVFALGGYTVRLCDLKDEILERSWTLIRSTLDNLAAFGRLQPYEIPETLKRIQLTTDLAGAVDGIDLAIEAVPEVPEIKKALFGKLNALCPHDVILASNTSGLDIFNIADVDSPERLIITHWFSPPHIIPLVEVVPGRETSKKVIDFTVNVLERLGKKPVVLKKFVPAFIVNRIQNVINAAIFEMIDNGWATAGDIDLAVKSTLGIRLPIVGVAQSLDFTGLDLIHTIFQQLGRTSAYIEKKVGDGHLGAKTSKGIYDYGQRSEAEILRQRDRLYFRMLEFLQEINAFEPV